LATSVGSFFPQRQPSCFKPTPFELSISTDSRPWLAVHYPPPLYRNWPGIPRIHHHRHTTARCPNRPRNACWTYMEHCQLESNLDKPVASSRRPTHHGGMVQGTARHPPDQDAPTCHSPCTGWLLPTVWSSGLPATPLNWVWWRFPTMGVDTCSPSPHPQNRPEMDSRHLVDVATVSILAPAASSCNFVGSSDTNRLPRSN
jgi:hypothetical protein